MDGRSDIFSLGAVLYEMVTGRRAFDGKSSLSVASAILEKEPQPIGAVKPMTPAGLDHAVQRCLAKDPEERWQTARDLKHELEWILTQPSGMAQPARRKRVLLYGALVLAAGLLMSLLFLTRTKHLESPANVESLIPAAEGTQFTGDGFAVSPDGK